MRYRNRHTGVILEPRNPDAERMLTASADFEAFKRDKPSKGRSKEQVPLEPDEP